LLFIDANTGHMMEQLQLSEQEDVLDLFVARTATDP